MRALLVEDHPEVRNALAEALTRRGHDVAAFPDAEAAWEAWQRQPFPLVLLDVALPGEDGLSLCRRLRADAFGASSVILIVTGTLDPHDLSELLASGADDYIAKPFAAGDLGIRLAVAERRAAEVAERWRVRGELAESDARFAAFMDHCPALAWLKDDEGRLVYINAAWERVYGLTTADVVGRTDYELWPEAAEELRANDRTVRETGRPLETVETVPGPDGEVRHFLASKFLSRDAGGRIFVGGMSVDITDRYRIERELAQERELLQVIMDNVPDFLYVKDRASRFVRANRAIARFMGLAEPSEVVGKTDFDFFPEALALQYFADEQTVMALGVPVINRLESQNEEGTLWSLTSTVPTTNDACEVTGLVGVSRDVTERLRVEEALRQSEERLRALLTAIPDIMFRFDREGTYLDCHGDHLSVLTRSPHDLIGKRLREVLSAGPAEVAEHAVQRAIDGGGVQVVEYDLLVRGQTRRYEARAVACAEREALMIVRDITERKALEERLAYQATHDPLTGLPNRTLLADRLGQALARADRLARGVALLFVDLDDFKIVNDTLGHESGDRLLVSVAQKLRESVRGADSVARLGGDEFAVLLEDLIDLGEAETVARRICDRLSLPVNLGGRDVVAAASVGVALSANGRIAAAELLRQADAAMYAAKRSGKSQFAFFAPGMDLAAWDRLGIDSELRGAIERAELVLHYQPIIVLATGQVSGAEALLRWQHPRRGLLGPAEFVPLAEESGMIVPIGKWVIAEACRQAGEWRRQLALAAPFRVLVNVSARQFRDPQLVAGVTQALADADLRPQDLQIELTEAALLDDVDEAAATLSRLRAMGVEIALDDFGAGYAGLGYLRQLPIDNLKIDRAVLAEVTGPHDAALLRSVVELGHALGKSVTVEGVEHAWQIDLIKRLGCTHAQGYWIAPPLLPDDLEAFLALRMNTAAGQHAAAFPLAS